MEDREAVRVLGDIMDGDDCVFDTVEFDTEHGSITFDMTEVPRELRMEYSKSAMGDLRVKDLDDFDTEDIEDMEDDELLQKALDESTKISSVVPGSERASKAVEVIQDSFEHDELGQSEIDKFVEEKIPDDHIFQIAKEIVEESKDVSGVTEFRINETRG